MFSVCSVLGMVAVPALLANQISTVDGYGPFQTGSGGEITIKLGAGMDGYAQFYHNSKALNQVTGTEKQPNIQTFCVEHAETVYGNTTYDVGLSSKTQMSLKELTIGAAYLYYNFADGSLAGYNFNGTTAARKTSADQLQKAIWYFMGEDLTIESSNPFWKLANDNGFGGLADYNNGRFGVEVINVWGLGHLNDPSYKRQDLLIRTSDKSYTPPTDPGVPVPDGGATVGLLGMALAGLATAGRKLRK